MFLTVQPLMSFRSSRLFIMWQWHTTLTRLTMHRYCRRVKATMSMDEYQPSQRQVWQKVLQDTVLVSQELDSADVPCEDVQWYGSHRQTVVSVTADTGTPVINVIQGERRQSVVGLYRILAPAPTRIRHFFQIRLQQKSHRSLIALPDLKSRFFPQTLHILGLEYLIDFSLSKIKLLTGM